MAHLNFAYSSATTRTIKEIQFGVFSPKETERLAVTEIVYPEYTYVVILCRFSCEIKTNTRA